MVKEGETHDTAGCLILAGKEALLVKREKPPAVGLWATLGGHVEKGELPYQAALREAYEEAGIDLGKVPDFAKQADKKGFIYLPHSAAEFIYPVEKSKKGPRHYHVSHVFLFRVKKQALKQELGDDRSGHVEWVPLSSLNEKNCFPVAFFLLRKLKLVK